MQKLESTHTGILNFDSLIGDGIPRGTAMTNEIPELFGSLKLTSYGISFISDNVILLRYVEVESSVTRALSILKMRGSSHDKDVREFKIGSSGVTILKKFEGQVGVLTGRPTAGPPHLMSC